MGAGAGGSFFSTTATGAEFTTLTIVCCWTGDLVLLKVAVSSAGSPWHSRLHDSPQYRNPVLLHWAVARCEQIGLAHLPDGPRIFLLPVSLFEVSAEIWTKFFELGKGKKNWRCESMRADSYPPWWHAIVGRNILELKRLLEEGLDPSRLVPEMGNPNIQTSPLAYIIGACQTEQLKIAIPYCSNINTICSTLTDGRTHTPLERSLLCSTHWEMAHTLIDNGAALTDDMIEKAKEMDKDVYYPIAGTSDRVIYDFYCHVRHMKATAWCMWQMGGAWPDIIEPVVRDRMGNNEFATDLWARHGEEEEDSSDSWIWSDDSSSSNSSSSSDDEQDGDDAGPRKRQKM
jgi:hypothetical protein